MIADRIRSIQAVSGGGGGGFDPSSVSGLIANWDASETSSVLDASGSPVAVDLTPVATWQDVSGSGFHLTQSTAGNQPVWRSGANGQGGLPLLYFTAANANFLQSTANLNTTDCTIIAVYALELPSKTSASVVWIGNNTSYRNRIYGRIGSNDVPRKDNASVVIWYGSATSNRRMVLSSKMYAAGLTQAGSAVEFLDSRFSPINDSQTISATPLSTTADIYVGSHPLAHTNYACQMKLGQILIYNRALNSTEYEYVLSGLNAKWSSSPVDVDPEYDRTSLILNMQGSAGSTTFTDSSPNNFTVTPKGNAQLASDATFGTVASFDGNGDYLTLPSNAAFAFGTGDFTVECWINFSALPASGQFLGIANTMPSLSWANFANWWLGLENAAGTTRLRLGRHGNGDVYAHANWAPSLNTWYHIAVTRSSGSVISIFINGVSQSVTTSGSNWVNDFSATGTLAVGVVATFPMFNGRIGPLRITKGSARYTANFTPPTGLFPTS